MTASNTPFPNREEANTDAARLRELRGLLQAVATEGGLHVALERIAHWVERASPDSLCSILLLDSHEGCLRHGAAPSLPDEYNRAIDGVAIGPSVGSCGTAAFRNEAVVVDNIAESPLWRDYSELAARFGLKSCWSQPIVSASNVVIGTFAIYRRQISKPNDEEWQLVLDAAQLASLVIERARADAARAEQEREMSSILSHATDQIFRLDRDGRISFVNEAAARARGRTPSACVGLTLDELGLNAQHVAAWRNAMRIAAETREVSRFEASVGSGDEEQWNETTVAPEFSEAGIPTTFVAVARDTTYRRRAEAHMRASEERLTLILNSSKQSIALLHTDGRFLDVGERVSGTVGMPRSRVLGARFWEMPNFAELPETQRSLREAIAQAAHGEANTGEVVWKRRDGSMRLGTYSIRPIRDGDGRITQLLLEGQDITEQRDMERRLRQSEKMESLGRLAGGIAHDFNNILAAIHGYGELLANDLPRTSEMSDYVAHLLKASRRARDLVRQILAFSRKSDIEHLSIDLRDVVEDAVRFLRASLPSTVEVVKRVPSTPVTILGDTSQISQVLLNLGSNAEYAMRASGHGRLEVALEEIELDAERANALGTLPGPHAHLSVSDTGGGISASVLSKIFEPFFTTKPVGEGTGMGLAVVHGIVHAHGGSVQVDSTLGVGTTFDVYLPSVQRPAETDPAPATVATGTGRVLVVDDEAAIANMLRRLLPRRGYDATCLTSATEALALFRANPDAFDVVVTDRTMPKMTGDALIAELHAVRVNLPVVLCSGQGHMGAFGSSDDSSAIVQQVSKPFELADLLRAMERARANAAALTVDHPAND